MGTSASYVVSHRIWAPERNASATRRVDNSYAQYGWLPRTRREEPATSDVAPFTTASSRRPARLLTSTQHKSTRLHQPTFAEHCQRFCVLGQRYQQGTGKRGRGIRERVVDENAEADGSIELVVNLELDDLGGDAPLAIRLAVNARIVVELRNLDHRSLRDSARRQQHLAWPVADRQRERNLAGEHDESDLRSWSLTSLHRGGGGLRVADKLINVERHHPASNVRITPECHAVHDVRGQVGPGD
eukprot:1415436-Rhodomonas_salina.3